MIQIRYIGALIYDIIILASIFILFTACCLFLQEENSVPPGTRWYQLALLGIIYCYYFFSYRFGGQTLGLRAWHLKLISDKTPLTHVQVLGRLTFTFPAFLFALIQCEKPHTILRRWTKTYFMIV